MKNANPTDDGFSQLSESLINLSESLINLEIKH